MYGPLKGSVSPEFCELGSQDSIRSFASRWLDSGRAIDVLSLNAGAQFVGATVPRRTKDGFELTVGVNHLGHFLLANLLLPAVEASTRDPRIVVTASEVCLHACVTVLANRTAGGRYPSCAQAQRCHEPSSCSALSSKVTRHTRGVPLT